ncbi:MAG: bacillithiol biosynthesis deacetylase BshB1 [Alphaproteobacteria bacterium]|nr:bacillithiol biosynthesis deacetylase BshB1 [Alphaproteobacteria bacterium]
MKLDILAFGAHPDDVELGCGGIISKEVSLGKKAGIIDLTAGELGSNGNAKTRLLEATQASKILGLSARENCLLEDGFFEINKKSITKIVQFIRYYKPEIVIANAIHDRHPDHQKGADLVTQACFISNLLKFKTTFKNKVQSHWKPSYVFHYIQDRFIEPHFIVDITGFNEQKLKSIYAYKSQFSSQHFKGVETYISKPNFIKNIENRAQLLGKRIGVEHAEGFTCQKSLGLNNFDNIILQKT